MKKSIDNNNLMKDWGKERSGHLEVINEAKKLFHHSSTETMSTYYDFKSQFLKQELTKKARKSVLKHYSETQGG